MNIKIFSRKKAEVKKVKKKKKKKQKKLSRTYHKSEQILKLKFFSPLICAQTSFNEENCIKIEN